MVYIPLKNKGDKLLVSHSLPSRQQLQRMDNAALLAWCLGNTWRHLGGRGGCPWVGERDNAKPPRPMTNADHAKADRQAYLRQFAPYAPRSALSVEPWAGGEHLHRCPGCEAQPRGEYHGRAGRAKAVSGPNGEVMREAPYWWCETPDADCLHPWEHPCHEHDPESAYHKAAAERATEDAAHEATGGDTPGDCYDGAEAADGESGPNGTNAEATDA